MKYTLQIAFSKPVGDILLRVCEYANKFGTDKANRINPLLFDFSGNIIEITHPQKDCPIEDAAILALEMYMGICLNWRSEWSEQLMDERDVNDFFERMFSEHIIEEDGVDADFHLLFYVPLYEEGVYKHVKYILENLPKGHKFVANIIGITYDVAWACGMLGKKDDREKCSSNMLQNVAKLADLTKLQNGRFSTIMKHVFLFQNYNLNGWSENFTQKKLIDVCANLSLALVEHYDTICRGSWDDYAWSKNEIKQSRPIYAINIQSRVIDTYLAFDRIIRDLFQGVANDNILDKDKVDKEKVKDAYKKILSEEVSLVGNFKKRFSNGLLNQADYETYFDQEVKEKIKSVITSHIESANLNVSEQQYLYSLFNSIDEHTDFESENFDDSIWQLEEMMLEQLDSDSNMLDVFRQLKRCSKDLSNTNDKIEELEGVVADLHQKLIENYPANVELTEDGFRIGNDVFKPYNCQDVPLEEDYEIPVGQVLPPSVDLRKNFSEIRNQGAQGACSAFSSVSVIEYFLSKIYNKQTDLSEAFVYYNARAIRGNAEKDEGATFADVIEAIRDHGVCVEEMCPYNPNVYDHKPTDEAYSDAESRKITEAKNIQLHVDDVKSALAQGYPVIISARAFDTYLLNANGVLNTPTDKELEDTEKNHAMVVCGYIDREGFFIVRNSWGKEFGDKGYCYLPYEYFRTPNTINQAYVVTGLNIAGFKAGDLPTIDTLLEGKDVNAQYSIYQNMILEARHELDANRDHLNDVRQEYLNLFNQIADYSNLELSLEGLKEKSEKERAILEDKLKEIAIAIEEKKQQKKGFFNRFKKSDTSDNFDEEKKQIEKEIDELGHYADNRKRQFRIRLVILNGLKRINLECVEESVRRQELSVYYEQQNKRIDEQNDADAKEYEYLKRLLPVEQIAEQVKTSDLVNLVSNLGCTISRIINGEMGLTESLEHLQQDIVRRICDKLDIRIADHLDDSVYDEFYNKLSHSAVMAQIEGSVPVGYGDETKYFFCNVEALPQRVVKECDGVMLLPIQDKLRMCFLHMEKYDIENFTIFFEEIERVKHLVTGAQTSVKGDQKVATYARFAAHVYGSRPNSILPKGCVVLDSIDDPKSGLKSALYSLGNNEAVCAFAGTRNGKDMFENIKQVVGVSSQYDKALEYAKELQKKYPTLEIVYVGHSQGGGEAAYCALNQGGKAYTFNPAGLSRITTWKGKSQFSRYKDIHAYIFWNDLLNNLQNVTPILQGVTLLPVDLTADGCIHYISDYKPKKESLAYYHGMQGILDYFGVVD